MKSTTLLAFAAIASVAYAATTVGVDDCDKDADCGATECCTRHAVTWEGETTENYACYNKASVDTMKSSYEAAAKAAGTEMTFECLSSSGALLSLATSIFAAAGIADLM